MIGYVKHFGADKRMSFKANDKKLFKIDIEIWEKISNLLGREFDSKTYYDENDKRYINSKIKFFNGDITTIFQGKGMPKQRVPHDCYSLIILDSIIRRNDKYFPQSILEECKYKIKKSKKKNCLNKNFASDLSDNEPNCGNDSDPDTDADDNESERSSNKSNYFC